MNKYPLIISNGGPAIVDPYNSMVTPTGGSTILAVEAPMMRNGDSRYHGELQYLALLQELVEKAAEEEKREDRTGTGVYSVFGRQMRFNLEDGFPLLTTKKMFTKGMVAELLWMLSGSTDAKVLMDQGVHIWDEWCKDGTCDLGPVYGKQWRSWYNCGDGWEDEIDQIGDLIENLKSKPFDRGHVVSAWNVADIPEMGLRPCHCLFQFYVSNGTLSCQLYQRSADIFLGVPFNIASYALLTHLIAREVDLKVGEFIHTFGDLHLYSNHVEQAKEQLTRTPFPFPRVEFEGSAPLFEITRGDIKFLDYKSHEAIKAEVSV